MMMLWVSPGALCLGSISNVAVDQLQKLQQEMDLIKRQIKKLEADSTERNKAAVSGWQNFSSVHFFLLVFLT